MKLNKLFLAALLLTVLDARAQVQFTEDNCLDGQDLNSEDIDISHCPALPNVPQRALLGQTGKIIDLGAWELGQTAEGAAYKYGSLSEPSEAQP